MIKTENLTKVYVNWSFLKKRTLIALDNVNIEIPEKQVFGFLGLNGAGKTSLMKILLGLSCPTSGKAWVLDKPAGNVGARQKIGYLPELPYFPRQMTPAEILDYYGGLFEMPDAVRHGKTEEVLRQVGLFEQRFRRLREFSKGMLQRVGFAQLLLNDPELLLIDEPTYGLDPLACKELRDVIFGLKDAGKTIFLNSHQISEVEKICDYIGILHAGRVLYTGPIQRPLEQFFVDTIRSAGGMP